MNRHLRHSGIFFLVIIASVFLIGFIDAWQAGAGFLLFIFGGFVLVVIFAIGSLICLIRGIIVARGPISPSHRVTAVIAVPGMMVITILLSWGALPLGHFSGTWTRLMLNRPYYEAIIAKVRQAERRASRSFALEKDTGIEYFVDDGPPVRVAFNPDGFLDNWSGIVFDPSGIVMQADGFDPKTGRFAAPDRVTKLFGGDLVSCRRLWDDYYDCSFT